MSNATPLVTIAVPFRRPGASFAQCLRSVFAQSFADWELLLLHDDAGDDDGSLALALALRDARVRVVSDGRNAGLAARLNQAAQLARGRYLFRMDADDVMHPERVKRQLAVLEGCGPDTVLGTAAYSIDADSRVVGLRPVLRPAGAGYARRHSFIHPTVAASTAWFLRHPYSEQPVFQRSEDAELWCRTGGESDFRWLNEPLLFYREVGLFSLRNYRATGEGLLELIRTHEAGHARRWQLGKQHGKLLLARGLHALGLTGMLVRARMLALTPEQLAEAEFALELALAASLPRAEATKEAQPCFA